MSAEGLSDACPVCALPVDASQDVCIDRHAAVVASGLDLPSQLIASVRELSDPLEGDRKAQRDDRRQKRRKIVQQFQQVHAATKRELHALAHVMAHAGVYVSSEVPVPEHLREAPDSASAEAESGQE